MSYSEQERLIEGVNRREAIRRVTALLGGVALVGGSSLLTACGKADDAARTDTAKTGTGAFSAEDIAYLDEIADTILPDTAKSPGAKAAKTGAFMALMVTDTYDEREQKTFRDGMAALDAASQEANKASFLKSTPEQRLVLLERFDKEAKDYMDRLGKAKEANPNRETQSSKDTAVVGPAGDKFLPDQRQENTASGDASAAAAITADAPRHWFRMMKELALLGFFTSEIGYTKAMRYVESPGRYDPCAPMAVGETSWAPHA